MNSVKFYIDKLVLVPHISSIFANEQVGVIFFAYCCHLSVGSVISCLVRVLW